MNWNVLWTALGETLYMAIPSTLIAYLIGLPLGVLLVITRKGGVKPLPTLNAVVGALVNFLRSIPFLIDHLPPDRERLPVCGPDGGGQLQ